MKIAVLIDGGFFLKRLPKLQTDDPKNAQKVVQNIRNFIAEHLKHINDSRLNNNRSPSKNSSSHPENPFNLLYRCFYYDARPYEGKQHQPISGKVIDFAKTPEAKFRKELFSLLKKERNFALRLGEVRPKSPFWNLKPETLDKILKKKITLDALTDEDFAVGLQQKGVDMRMGIDIAHMALRKQVDTLILVAGDADFVPASKLARREGLKVILDPLWHNVSENLHEHIDELRSGFKKPSKN